ncbi:polysaccharide deacetylase family protein [Ferrovibrio sp.]|uniref:polysaccharide deacetylase family protein n=1 Tax=Ferrovibrio sp. TaxID=1917215 RepID=UPI003D0BC9D8
MSNWAALDAELDAWAAAGRKALFWWRDDDAGTLTPALQRLLDLQAANETPLSLAVIPARADADLAEALRRRDAIAVLQHGFAHHNHAPMGEKKAEFPGSRPAQAALADLRQGREALKKLFGYSLRPVLVPPWNRISAALLPHLPRLGLHGLSTFKPRGEAWAAPGLMQVNTHLDPIDWRQGAGFLGETACLDIAIAQLRQSRETADAEPLGLLTHHAQQDEATWAFAARFIAHTRAHRTALWIDIDSAFGAGPAA